MTIIDKGQWKDWDHREDGSFTKKFGKIEIVSTKGMFGQANSKKVYFTLKEALESGK